MIIEQGIDLEGKICWFVLKEANLLGIFSSEEEAQNFINSY